MMERSKKRSLHQRFPRSEEWVIVLQLVCKCYLHITLHLHIRNIYTSNNRSAFTIGTSHCYLYTSGNVRIEKCKCYISLLADKAEQKLWKPVCKEPNKASEWPSSFVQKRLPRYKYNMVEPVSQQFITCSSMKEPHNNFATRKTKTQQLSLEKSPVPSFIPNFFPQRSSLEARGIFVIGWEGPSDLTCHAASPFFDAPL